MQPREIIRYLLLRTIGNFLVLFALFGFSATFGPALYYELQFRLLQSKGVAYSVVEKNILSSDPPQISSGFGALLSDAKTHIMIPKSSFFSVLIPKIGANAKIIPNVDPGDEDEYKRQLQDGVAHAKGTVFPGINGTTYLFAHSTDAFWNVGRYNAIFYLLKDLDRGDDIVIFFKDKRYNYRVINKKIVGGNDTSYLRDAQSKNKQELILQTCWPPGTTWQRLLIFAEPLQKK